MHLLPQEDLFLLKKVLRFSRITRQELYLVGGYLRDILVNRKKENPDIDFCLKGNAIKYGRQLAQQIKAGFVVLDVEHGCCRLVKKVHDKIYTLDFADFRTTTLESDLLHRDFTINTLALRLEDAFKQQDIKNLLIDKCGAITDLKRKVIRMISSKSFDDDPLRILRAFSLSCIFGFKIEKNTLRAVKAKKNSLSKVSFERIREEFFKILDSADTATYLTQMDKLGVLKQIIPEIEIMRGVYQGPYHHLDVLKHSLETVRQMDDIILNNRNKEIQGYLNHPVSGQKRRLGLIKLGAFLHDVGKPGTLRRRKGKIIFHGHERKGAEIVKVIAKRLKLSNEELLILRKVVFWHLRPGYLGDMEKPTERAKFRFFRDATSETVAILLISLADQRSTRGPLTSRQSRLQHEKTVAALIREYFKKQKEVKLPRLINGNEVMSALHLSAGPLIGKILSKIQELQATGRISTKEEALQAAEKIKGKNK